MFTLINIFSRIFQNMMQRRKLFFELSLNIIVCHLLYKNLLGRVIQRIQILFKSTSKWNCTVCQIHLYILRRDKKSEQSCAECWQLFDFTWWTVTINHQRYIRCIVERVVDWFFYRCSVFIFIAISLWTEKLTMDQFLVIENIIKYIHKSERVYIYFIYWLAL